MRDRTAALACVLAILACSKKTPPPTKAVGDELRPMQPVVIAPRDELTGVMIRLPGGTFGMGSTAEGPEHEVTVADFFLDRTEVTVAAYRACVAATACSPAATKIEHPTVEGSQGEILSAACNAGKPERGPHPINCVSWAQATAFCTWAEKRLPTEAEWEYAAGGKDGTDYPWGYVPYDMEAGIVNACGKECPLANTFADYEDAFPTTSPVGAFPLGASRLGVMDLSGNVFEWVDDRYCPYHGKAPCGVERVARGGGWSDELYRAANPRKRFTRTRRAIFEIPDGVAPEQVVNSVLGFRCARTAKTALDAGP